MRLTSSSSALIAAILIVIITTTSATNFVSAQANNGGNTACSDNDQTQCAAAPMCKYFDNTGTCENYPCSNRDSIDCVPQGAPADFSCFVNSNGVCGTCDGKKSPCPVGCTAVSLGTGGPGSAPTCARECSGMTSNDVCNATSYCQLMPKRSGYSCVPLNPCDTFYTEEACAAGGDASSSATTNHCQWVMSGISGGSGSCQPKCSYFFSKDKCHRSEQRCQWDETAVFPRCRDYVQCSRFSANATECETTRAGLQSLSAVFLKASKFEKKSCCGYDYSSSSSSASTSPSPSQQQKCQPMCQCLLSQHHCELFKNHCKWKAPPTGASSTTGGILTQRPECVPIGVAACNASTSAATCARSNAASSSPLFPSAAGTSKNSTCFWNLRDNTCTFTPCFLQDTKMCGQYADSQSTLSCYSWYASNGGESKGAGQIAGGNGMARPLSADQLTVCTGCEKIKTQTLCNWDPSCQWTQQTDNNGGGGGDLGACQRKCVTFNSSQCPNSEGDSSTSSPQQPRCRKAPQPKMIFFTRVDVSLPVGGSTISADIFFNTSCLVKQTVNCTTLATQPLCTKQHQQCIFLPVEKKCVPKPNCGVHVVQDKCESTLGCVWQKTMLSLDGGGDGDGTTSQQFRCIRQCTSFNAATCPTQRCRAGGVGGGGGEETISSGSGVGAVCFERAFCALKYKHNTSSFAKRCAEDPDCMLTTKLLNRNITTCVDACKFYHSDTDCTARGECTWSAASQQCSVPSPPTTTPSPRITTTATTTAGNTVVPVSPPSSTTITSASGSPSSSSSPQSSAAPTTSTVFSATTTAGTTMNPTNQTSVTATINENFNEAELLKALAQKLGVPAADIVITKINDSTIDISFKDSDSFDAPQKVREITNFNSATLAQLNLTSVHAAADAGPPAETEEPTPGPNKLAVLGGVIGAVVVLVGGSIFAYSRWKAKNGGAGGDDAAASRGSGTTASKFQMDFDDDAYLQEESMRFLRGNDQV